jgi:hypothetical protein
MRLCAILPVLIRRFATITAQPPVAGKREHDILKHHPGH